MNVLFNDLLSVILWIFLLFFWNYTWDLLCFILIINNFEHRRSEELYLTVLNFTIFPKERRTLLRSLFEKIFIYYSKFNSLIEMSRVYVFMYGNSCLIKSIFFEVEKIKVCLTLLNDCRFERNGFNIIMTWGMSFINETLKSLFTFRIELNTISKIIFNLWRLDLNKILFVIFDLLLNLLVLLVVFNFNCFFLIMSHISLL